MRAVLSPTKQRGNCGIKLKVCTSSEEVLRVLATTPAEVHMQTWQRTKDFNRPQILTKRSGPRRAGETLSFAMRIGDHSSSWAMSVGV